ncbi:MAG TPA: hypothetical protein VL961_08460 [Acidimicrobiales bacterium]|nr:hypothetical protein [Acidimicrobiales bacterium]
MVEVSPGTARCPKCGAAINPTVVPLARPKRSRRSRARLQEPTTKNIVVGAGSVVLLVSLWLPWYSLGPFSADGLSAHGWLFIAVLDAIVLVLYALITAFDAGDLVVPGRMSKEQLLALMTGVNLALVVLGFLLKPSGFSWAWAGYVAVIAALVAFLPFGLPAIRERRQH